MTSASGLALPAWRGLLESRWQRRLAAVIRLSVAYHDASDRLDDDRLMREAVAARRALSDTEEALARLSAGNYGRCEQCGTAIPLAELAAEPEARYCRTCAGKGSQTKLHGR
jgi:RNA polymerase-binding transcription factor DksA